MLAAVKDASASLKRWPEDGPSLTAAVRGGAGYAQVGTEGWCRSNKRMGGVAMETNRVTAPAPSLEGSKLGAHQGSNLHAD